MKESDLLFGLLISFGKSEYTFSDIVWLTTPFHISETSIRANLSRMAGKNIVEIRKEGKRAFYRISQKSKKYSSNVALSFHIPDWSGWVNNWWGLSISLPEGQKSERYRLHKKLAAYRFSALHRGFWIRPYNASEEIDQRLSDIFHHRYTKVMVFQFHGGDDLRTIQELWHVKLINRHYKECLRYVESCYNDFNLDDPEEALVAKMTVGDILVKQLAKDPLLPDTFLPSDWQGNQLRKVFGEWIKLTTAKSKPYWEKIFADLPAKETEQKMADILH